MVATKTDTGTDSKTIELSKKSKPKKVAKKADPGKWEPICIIAQAQDVDESGKLLMSQSKVMLEQHTKTKEVRTVTV